ILHVVFVCELVHRRKECVILWSVDVWDSSLKEGQLKVFHFFPVDHLSVKIELELVDQNFNIVYCLLGVPSCIDVKYQRTQSQFLCPVGEVRTVDTAAHSHDAVKILSPPFVLYFFDYHLEFCSSACVCVPVGKNTLVKNPTMIAHTVCVKHNLRVGGVHDTV